MNQGRIWCVAHPTVGLPLLLGSVAVTSLIVHTAIMTHTTWMSSYWMGSARNRVAMEGNGPAQAATVTQNGSSFSMTVAPTPVPGAPAQTAFVITVTPALATTATAVADPDSQPPAKAVLAANGN